MNLFAEALSKKGLKVTDFEDKAVEVNEFDEQIKFWETWLKMLERNASEKEKHNFLTKNGFVSIKQFGLWSQVTDDYHNLEMQLDFEGEFMSDAEKAKMVKEIEEKKSMAECIKRPSYYSLVMRQLRQKDISPYGEDILKSISSSVLNRERVWREEDFKKCEGLWHF